MKRILLFAAASVVWAQNPSAPILIVGSNPAGTGCGSTSIALYQGTLYTCVSGSYAAVPSGGSNLTTPGAVPYVSASGVLNQDAANFFWDSTNHRLGIGTNTPSYALDVPAQNVRMGTLTLGTTGTGINSSAGLSMLLWDGNFTELNGAGPNGSINIAARGTGWVAIGNQASPNNDFNVEFVSSTSYGTARFQDQTATTGHTLVLIDRGAADTATTNLFTVNGVVKFGGSNTTGSGAALLGSNSPAATLTAPYTWIRVLTSDGSTAYIPAWK